MLVRDVAAKVSDETKTAVAVELGAAVIVRARGDRSTTYAIARFFGKPRSLSAPPKIQGAVRAMQMRVQNVAICCQGDTLHVSELHLM